MNNRIILAMMLFAMVFVGLQTAPPVSAAATKIDQFNVYFIGGGQNDDAQVDKVYQYSVNHLYITVTGYNLNPKTHKYRKNGYHYFYDLKKITKTKLKITEPKMEGSKSFSYIYTKHTAAYYYWHKFRKELRQT